MGKTVTDKDAKAPEKGRLKFDFNAVWGWRSREKPVDDVEREVRIFFKAGCTPEDLLDDLNAFGRDKEREAYALMADPKGVPVVMAIKDFRRCHVAVASALARGSQVQALEYAVRHGADIELSGLMEGEPPIVQAAQSCQRLDQSDHVANREELRRELYANTTKMLRLLIEEGADVNATDRYGRTALMHAAAAGHLEAVELLLEHGAHVWPQDEKGKSALHHAATGQQKGEGYCHVVETVRVLMAAGANPMQRNFQRHTVLHTMAVEGQKLTRGEFDPIIRMLLDGGAHLEARTRDGQTALVLAMRNESGAKVLIPGFIEAGADTEVVTPQGTGLTRFGNAEAKRLLKAATMAKKIGGAMSEPQAEEEEPAEPSTNAKTDSFGIL